MLPVPPRKPPGFVQQIANDLAQKTKELQRALPNSKGGETPKQLQTYRTEIYTYFTEATADSQLLYSAENWVRIKLLLETAGPVAIGTKSTIVPVLGGNGVLLDTGVPYEAYLAKGTRFYITSETVNRICVTIEPVPWLEQIDQDTVSTQEGVRAAVIQIGNAIVNAVNALRGMAHAMTSSGKALDQLPQPAAPPDRRLAPRLTPISPPRKTR